MQERRKDLEWFGLPERNTLRPLWYCIDCVGPGWNLVWTCVRVYEPCLLTSKLSLL
jgi:hypothetical protein